MPRCQYRIEPRSPNEGGLDAQKVRGLSRGRQRGFLANPYEDSSIILDGFHRLPEDVQDHWLKTGSGERLIDAWRAYLTVMAIIDRLMPEYPGKTG